MKLSYKTNKSLIIELYLETNYNHWNDIGYYFIEIVSSKEIYFFKKVWFSVLLSNFGILILLIIISKIFSVLLTIIKFDKDLLSLFLWKF